MKKLLCILLSVVLLLTSTVAASFAEENTQVDPVILVHGMAGRGEYAYGKNDVMYWGHGEDTDVLKLLRSNGIPAYAPTVGPLSSAWDRACELYAQLTGTVVDYGAAHSAACGHERFGRDYTGNGCLSPDWYENGKINLVSHSFGGQTCIIFISLLAIGSEEERNACTDVSPLFEGGHEKAVFSLTTLESPSQGALAAELVKASGVGVYAAALLMNLMSTSEEPFMDFMLDQFGITVDPSTGGRAHFNLPGVIRLAKSGDNCAYDMTLQGAREISEKFPTNPNTYYFSVSANQMEKNKYGVLVPTIGHPMLNFGGVVNAALAGKTYSGIETDESWAYSDGVVPVPSAKHPYGAPYEETDGSSVDNLTTGIWYCLPTVYGGHGYGMSAETVFSFWPGYMERITALSAK